MIFQVRYFDADELLMDQAEQFERGGFLVRVEPPAGLARDSQATLQVSFEDHTLEWSAAVLQLIPGHGVALAFECPLALAQLLERAKLDQGRGGQPALHELLLSDNAPPAEPSFSRSSSAPDEADPEEQEGGNEERGEGENREDKGEDSLAEKIAKRAIPRSKKIHMARYGDLPDRELVLRDSDRSLQRFVLTNPSLSLVEVKRLAGLSTTLPQTLKAIADRREWAQRPEIALAILRNPKTPVPVAIAVLQSVGKGELRVLVKSGSLRTPILNAARKLTGR